MQVTRPDGPGSAPEWQFLRSCADTGMGVYLVTMPGNILCVCVAWEGGKEGTEDDTEGSCCLSRFLVFSFVLSSLVSQGILKVCVSKSITSLRI